METTTKRQGPRPRIGRQGESGQILLMYLIFLLPMTMIALSVFNIGQAASEKMRVQNAADNAAYSAAVWEARYMNLTAYVNRTMVANYDTIALLVGLWSTIDAADGFVRLAENVLTLFFGLGRILEPFHEALHQANDALHDVVGGSAKNRSVAFAIETYNERLSEAQRALYLMNQLGRRQLVRSIAAGVDSRVEFWAPSEAFNLQSLKERNRWEGTDPDDGLRLTLEHSLNALSNGESIRDFDNFLPGPLREVQRIIDNVPCFDLSIGPQGYNGPGFDHVTGAATGCGPGEELNKCDPKTIARDETLYQNDHNGVVVKFDCFVDFTLVSLGHNSDDALNKGIDVPHIADDRGDHAGDFISDNIECSTVGGFTQQKLNQDPNFNRLKDLNARCQNADPGNAIPDNLQAVDQDGNPNTNDAKLCSDVQRELKDISDKIQDELKKQAGNLLGAPCQTRYDWATKLRDMEVTTYVQDDALLDGRRLEGPSSFVIFRKPAPVLPLLRGLNLDTGLGNIEAYALAKTYYTQRRRDVRGVTGDGLLGDPRESNKESMFNPFWAARLEKPGPASKLAGFPFLH